MTNPVNVTDIVSFILRHRRNNAFTNETVERLNEVVNIAIEQSCLLVDFCDDGKIYGVILANNYATASRLHIHAIVCVRSSSLAKFAHWLEHETTRRNWTLTATRRGKQVTYKNTRRFLQKLISTYG